MLSGKSVMLGRCSLATSAPGTAHLAFHFLQTICRTEGGSDAIQPNQCRTFKPGFLPYLDDRVRDTLSENNVSWRRGISYKTHNRDLIYATLSKGYHASRFPTGAAAQDVQCEHHVVEGG